MGESNAEYHGDLTHVGSTMLKDFRKSRRRYKALYVDRTMEREPPSPEMLLGSMTHLLVGGFPLSEEFVIARGCDQRNGNTWKAYKELAEADGKLAIPEGWIAPAQAMADQVLLDEIAGKFWEADGPMEEPIRWQRNGLYVKCKPDKLVDDLTYDWRLCISLKTSAKAELPGFYWAIRDYEYDLSEAMYCDGCEVTKPADDPRKLQVVMVVVSKEPPHDVYTYLVGEHGKTMCEGRIKYEDTTKALSNCFKTGDWLTPGQKRMQTI